MALSIADSHGAGDDDSRGFMLFGVKVMAEGSFRKSVSMNNLVQYDGLQPHDSNSDVAAGYASDDVVHPSARIRDRKRGVAWSEEEHRLFLLGLQSVGKGDWRGISRNYVKTRTPTQVASHAQKYFLRRSNHSRRRRRSSLFDITTDEVMGSSPEDQVQILQQNTPTKPPPPPPQQQQQEHNFTNNPMAVTIPSIPTGNFLENPPYMQVNQLTNSPKPIMSIPILPIPSSSTLANLNLNKTNTSSDSPPALSPRLAVSSPSRSVTQDEEQSPSTKHQSTTSARALQTMSGSFNGGSGGDSIISVA